MSMSLYVALQSLYITHLLLLLLLRGCGPLQLSGMTACSVTNGVEVWRPLLAHCKEQIFDFAHR